MAQEHIVKFSLPDTITVGHWETYAIGRQAYIDKQNGKANGLLADYAGALALIKAGVVHVEGPDLLKQYLSAPDQTLTPLAVVGLLIENIAKPVAAAVEGPLPWATTSASSNESSPTSTIQ
jgi:hypothetical protein